MDNIFFSITNKKIGDTISDVFLQQGVKIGEEEQTTVYKFPSENPSLPHYIKVTSDNQLVFYRLTVPATNRTFFTDELLFLGQAEVELRKVDTEILLGFPSQGKAYVVNGRGGTVVQIMRFPISSKEEFETKEGNAYKTVTRNEENTQLLLPQNSLWENGYIQSGILLGVLLLSIAAYLIIRRKIKHFSKSH